MDGEADLTLTSVPAPAPPPPPVHLLVGIWRSDHAFCSGPPLAWAGLSSRNTGTPILHHLRPFARPLLAGQDENPLKMQPLEQEPHGGLQAELEGCPTSDGTAPVARPVPL